MHRGNLELLRSRCESKLENMSQWPEAQVENCSGDERRKDKGGGKNKRGNVRGSTKGSQVCSIDTGVRKVELWYYRRSK